MEDTSIHLYIGREELTIRRRYETLAIANDFLAGVTFVLGSVLFFSEATTYAATWMFLVGSVLFLLRPAIRLSRRIHLTRRHGGDPDGAHESSMDF